MGLKLSSPEELAQGQEFLRAAVRPPETEIRNAATAAEGDAISIFEYRGIHFKAPPLSYRVGIQLQEIYYTLQKLGRAEESKEFPDEESQVEHLEKLAECYERALKLFQESCYPIAFWRRWRHKRKNPFSDASSAEIGELLSFFSLCRTKSRVRLQPSLMHRPSLTMSMRQTTSPTL